MMIFGMFDEIEAAAAREHDVAASEVDRFHRALRIASPALDRASQCRAPEEVSVLDAGRYCDTRLNYAVKDGYGRLIEKLSCGLAVRCDSPVTEIETTSNSSACVAISGRSNAPRSSSPPRSASSRPVPSRSIRSPTKPLRRRSTTSAWGPTKRPSSPSTGRCSPFRRTPRASTAILPTRPKPTICRSISRFSLGTAARHQPFGRRPARPALASAGERGLIDSTISKLVRAFGADIRRHIVGTVVTSWGRNPFIRGGYAIARPGRAKSRERLIAGDISDRVFLAGEACHPYWYATAHGAYLTGIDRAHRALSSIDWPVMLPDPLWLPPLAAAAGG